MKGWLFDQNLPRRVAFSPALPVVHATSIAASPSDSDIWEYAREHQLAVVTKDADFSDRIIVASPPPWVVHIRIGNVRRRQYHELLARVWPHVEALLPARKLVNIYHDRVEGVS
jgi:predicted nuclease of predicted toxin-antitoxin system